MDGMHVTVQSIWQRQGVRRMNDEGHLPSVGMMQSGEQSVQDF